MREFLSQFFSQDSSKKTNETLKGKENERPVECQMPAPFADQREKLESMGIIIVGETRAIPKEGEDPWKDPATCTATLPIGWRQKQYGSGSGAIIDDKGVTRVNFVLVFASGARADSPEGNMQING